MVLNQYLHGNLYKKVPFSFILLFILKIDPFASSHKLQKWSYIISNIDIPIVEAFVQQKMNFFIIEELEALWECWGFLVSVKQVDSIIRWHDIV